MTCAKGMWAPQDSLLAEAEGGGHRVRPVNRRPSGPHRLKLRCGSSLLALEFSSSRQLQLAVELLPPIYMRRGVKNDTSTPWSFNSSPSLESFATHPRCFRQTRGVGKYKESEESGKCRVCRHSSPLVPRRMLINHSKCS